MKCPKCQADNSETQRFCGECGADLLPVRRREPGSPTETLQAPVKELTTGSLFAGRYQVIEELGKGGMGRVYKVLDNEIQEKIALKLIKPDVAEDRETIERFRNELKLARKIGHRNVCKMYDLNKEVGSYYITMEYVAGEDLKSMIRMAGQLGIGSGVNIAKQVCDGLAEAHSLGVVHRDLKPQNIMIDKGGNAKIMDFGIARSLRDRGLTGASVMIGTPEYMSPEQAEAKEVDQRSDIYSLGVILYEMATGRVPFEGETALSIAMKHKGETPKDPKEINPSLPEDLSRLILKCLEKDRAKRFQAAAEVRAELEGIEQGIPTTDRVIPSKKPLTSREITVKFSVKKLIVPALVLIAVVIAFLAYFLLLARKAEEPTTGAKKSVAVLPFADLSPAKDREYLCDGIAETLINALSSIPDLHVPARTSASFFKGKAADIKEIGQKLNAATVLEGSVQVAENRLRVTARLSNVADGYQLWSETYERGLEGVFAIQDDIARAIVQALKIKLLGERKEMLVKESTGNLEAYNLYLQGRYFWEKRGEKNLLKAIEYFKKAIEIDPEYALAYAGLADSYFILGDNLEMPPQETFPQAKEAALKALHIDPNIPEAHTSLAAILEEYDYDFERAEKEYKLAIELNPGYATAHHWYAAHFMCLGQHKDAIREILLARELDPLSPRISANVGYVLCFAREYERALEELKTAIEIFPGHSASYDYMAAVYTYMGNYEEAIRARNRVLEMAGLPPGQPSTSLAYIYAVSGKKDEARKMLDSIIENLSKEYFNSVSIAGVFVALGDKEKAFSWLEKAFSGRDARLTMLKVYPEFDPLRPAPRFTALLKRIGLEK